MTGLGWTRGGRWTALLVTAALWVGCGSDPVQPQEGTLSVLMVGNSLTLANDLPGMLQRLFELGGVEAVVDEEALPGFGLPDHWARNATMDRIRSGPWSVVVLQQGPSATEGRPYLLEYAELFAGEIRGAGSTPAFYMVWPSRARFFDFDGVLDSYRTAADTVDGLFLPAGESWRIAWEQNNDLPFYGPDDFHPSFYGTYMAALVMYEQLSGQDPRDLPRVVPTPDGDVPLDDGVALLLQEAAVEANRRHARSVTGWP